MFLYVKKKHIKIYKNIYKIKFVLELGGTPQQIFCLKLCQIGMTSRPEISCCLQKLFWRCVERDDEIFYCNECPKCCCLVCICYCDWKLQTINLNLLRTPASRILHNENKIQQYRKHTWNFFRIYPNSPSW